MKKIKRRIELGVQKFASEFQVENRVDVDIQVFHLLQSILTH